MRFGAFLPIFFVACGTPASPPVAIDAGSSMAPRDVTIRLPVETQSGTRAYALSFSTRCEMKLRPAPVTASIELLSQGPRLCDRVRVSPAGRDFAPQTRTELLPPCEQPSCNRVGIAFEPHDLFWLDRGASIEVCDDVITIDQKTWERLRADIGECEALPRCNQPGGVECRTGMFCVDGECRILRDHPDKCIRRVEPRP